MGGEVGGGGVGEEFCLGVIAMIFSPSHLLCTIKSQMGVNGGGGAWYEWGRFRHSYATV